MDIKFNLVQKQILTHQNIQGLNILSMSTFELNNYIEAAALENPVLVVEDSPPEDIERANLISKLQWLEATDEQNKAYYKGNSEMNEEGGFYDFLAQPPKSLVEFLSEQIEYMKLSKKEAEVCLLIIHRLDDNGYLDNEFYLYEEFCEIETQLLEQCVSVVQSLEPTGVGARSLAECLKLQLQAEGSLDELMPALIENDLIALSKKQFAKLAKKYNATAEGIELYFNIISKLNPKPGANYTNEIYHHYIIPDALIYKVAGEFAVELNAWSTPRISISKAYLDRYNGVDDIETKRYIEEKLRQAKSITNNISKRNDTLLRVTREILNRQKSFFENGAGHIKPLKMSDIAEALSVHVSTVSRTVRGKYLQCSFGVFSYKHFFSVEIASDKGGGESAERIKEMVKSIIESEDKANPCSDLKLTEALNDMGIQIKRRTVAKYRTEMNIPPAFMRKK